MSKLSTFTLYCSPSDTWEGIQEISEISKEQLIELNPHLSNTEILEAGIPIDVPLQVKLKFNKARISVAVKTPYAIAQEELLIGVAEDHRLGHDNTRIKIYHGTTSGGAMPDEVAWCSSFVNFCVEQAGLIGTDSKAARSWLNWGGSVPKNDWRTGDVMIFRRGSSSWQGHVGFLADLKGERPLILGGNQNNRVSLASPYPYSAILDVRRR